MSQQHTQAVPQPQSKTPVPAAVPPVPQPIDPNLLRQISGGTESAPKYIW